MDLIQLYELLHIDPSTKCVSICGSGGKSSLCLALAKAAIAAGKKSAVTTTTHIGCRQGEDRRILLSADAKELESILNAKLVPVAGKREGEKLSFGGQEQFEMLLQKTDVLFVEADGSKMLPLKYPNDTEPVIPKGNGEILTVCGLSALNRPLAEVCHRLPLAESAIQDLGEKADEKAIAALLWFGYGKYNPVFVLNQADTERELYAAEKIRSVLEDYGAKRISILSLKNLGLAAERFF